jgi:hypothetical protein
MVMYGKLNQNKIKKNMHLKKYLMPLEIRLIRKELIDKYKYYPLYKQNKLSNYKKLYLQKPKMIFICSFNM